MAERKSWTTKDLRYLKKSALLDTTNKVVNVDAMAKKLGVSPNAVFSQIYKLRASGELPQVDKTLQIDSSGRGYSDKEKKAIIKMYENNIPTRDIAKRFDRSLAGINSFIGRYRAAEKIKGSRREAWSESEDMYLLESIIFDENGYTHNTNEIATFLKRSEVSVRNRIAKLRKKGFITVKPKKGTTSIKSKKAHEQFNNARFLSQGRSETRMQENAKRVQTVTSRVVQVILTVIIDEQGNESNQYFTLDGSPLKTKKATATNSD